MEKFAAPGKWAASGVMSENCTYLVSYPWLKIVANNKLAVKLRYVCSQMKPLVLCYLPIVPFPYHCYL